MFLRTLPGPASASASLVIWDDSPCPLCGRQDEETVLEAMDPAPVQEPALWFAVVRCRRCGLHYTNPRPDEFDIARFYSADYRPHRKLRKVPNPSHSWFGKLTRKQYSQRTGIPWHGRGRLLDFGCGSGAFLKLLADQGWHVTGLDSSATVAETVQRELGIPVVVGTLPHEDLPPCGFDVLTMWHSLEHVHRPLAVLREAYQLLVPGGRLVVECPNWESWSARQFGPAWFGLDLPRHLTHFTASTLSEMLTAAGFRVEGVHSVRHSDWLRSSAKRAAAYGQSGTWMTILQGKLGAKLAAGLASVFGGGDSILAVAERPDV